MFARPLRKIDITRSRFTMRYSNLRNGSTDAERRCYNRSENILLTFDDFAAPSDVQSFLAILDDNRVHAIFFLLGTWAAENQDLVSEIRRRGHTVGNHSSTHRRLRSESEKVIRQEIVGGVKSSLLRPPFGAFNERVRAVALEEGHRLGLWTIDSEDWKGLSVGRLRDRVRRELHPGACILLHLNGENTLMALPSIIEDIRAEGYKLSMGGNDLQP